MIHSEPPLCVFSTFFVLLCVLSWVPSLFSRTASRPVMALCVALAVTGEATCHRTGSVPLDVDVNFSFLTSGNRNVSCKRACTSQSRAVN